jgi:hypothetical protein
MLVMVLCGMYRVTVHARASIGHDVIRFLELLGWHVRRLVPGSPTQLMTFTV